MTDNRTNELNKYAGFVARQNHQRDPWRGICHKCLCGVVFDSDVDHAMHQVEAILEAAIEAATRVPVQGEPNDDREALRKEFEFRIRTAIAHGCALGYRELSAQERDEWVRGQVDRAVGSRADGRTGRGE